MKQIKSTMIIAFMAVVSCGYSQIVLEKTYAQYVEVGLKNNGDAIYYNTEVNDAGVIQFYDNNHALIQSTDLSNIFKKGFAEFTNDENDEGKAIVTVVYCTDKLFDLDNQIEFVIEASILNSTGLTDSNFLYIVDGDGSVMLSRLNGSIYTESTVNAIYFDGVAYKMKIGIRSENDNNIQEIYSLPGTINTITSIETSLEKNLQPKAYPNPAIEYTRIAYELPAGNSSADLVIYNSLGKEIQRLKVGEIYKDVLVNTTSFQEGTYIYYLITDGSNFQQGKFIVMK